jgi:hypothetical protein
MASPALHRVFLSLPHADAASLPPPNGDIIPPPPPTPPSTPRRASLADAEDEARMSRTPSLDERDTDACREHRFGDVDVSPPALPRTKLLPFSLCACLLRAGVCGGGGREGEGRGGRGRR